MIIHRPLLLDCLNKNVPRPKAQSQLLWIGYTNHWFPPLWAKVWGRLVLKPPHYDLMKTNV